METKATTVITVKTTLNAPVATAWESWNEPKHITQWCAASEDWHAPKAENDLREGGRFTTRMEAKDGSFGFDFGGVYTKVIPHQLIEYTMDDNRKVSIAFNQQGNATEIVESFDAEKENPEDMQQAGWQAILDNYKNYTEQL
ncbi:MAG: SRPBCC family protein [Candidatus Pseudobacter hemicellulosilyticus]|uniref:SRPBCC family protein n=1 Tax=Candidatus Pseudobacter hemicellulosilyticus TaxID=3121375 RepID=A0AAJ5WMN3_9BACT|nr:MAG: SRPBCC family protein [Pseudobacter sp.]